MRTTTTSLRRSTVRRSRQVLRVATGANVTTGDGEGEPEEADEDNMEEIDQDNIMGRRTRGKNIDFAQAAKNMEDDDDEEDDDDFVDPDDDKMEE